MGLKFQNLFEIVQTYFFQELAQPNNWDIFIGHFLGVDHAGHKFGPNHSEMRRKLTEMNKVIQKTVEMMPDDCVLFVMGDHGKNFDVGLRKKEIKKVLNDSSTFLN